MLYSTILHYTIHYSTLLYNTTTYTKISQFVAISQQVVFTLLLPSCQQIWNKLSAICNNLVDIISLVARFISVPGILIMSSSFYKLLTVKPLLHNQINFDVYSNGAHTITNEVVSFI
jgi:hypothetical protein